MPKKLLSPEAAHDFLHRRFGNQRHHWLAGEGAWPLRVTLGSPAGQDIAEDARAVGAWASAWQSWSGPGEVVFETRQFARFGRHRLPVALMFATAADVAAAVGESHRWERACERYRRMLGTWPVLARGGTLTARFDVLADWARNDFERLLSLLAWLDANPASGLYLRQLPVEGLDTKWLQTRMGLVAGLLRSLRGVGDDGGDSQTLFGLRKPPHRVRLRLLCPGLRRLAGGLGDIVAPVEDLAALPIAPGAVIVVENLETGLALPDLAGTLVVMGLGNAVSALGMLPWLKQAAAIYWGDIDTHGFAILDRARQTVPQLRSVLMDEATLLAHRPLWGQEETPCADLPFERLTAEERQVYETLRDGIWGARVRLEQERLDWAASLRVLRQALDTQGR